MVISNASFFAAEKLEEYHNTVTRELGQVRGEIGESRREQASQASLIAATSSLILNQVSEIASAYALSFEFPLSFVMANSYSCIVVRVDSL